MNYYLLLTEIGINILKNYLVDTNMFTKKTVDKISNQDFLYLCEQITIDYKR